MAQRISVVEEAAARIAAVAGDEGRPDLKGKLVDRGLAEAERAPALEPGLALRPHQEPGAA